MTCSNRWAKPVLPGCSCFEPTSYQRLMATTGARWSSATMRRRPLARRSSLKATVGTGWSARRPPGSGRRSVECVDRTASDRSGRRAIPARVRGPSVCSAMTSRLSARPVSSRSSGRSPSPRSSPPTAARARRAGPGDPGRRRDGDRARHGARAAATPRTSRATATCGCSTPAARRSRPAGSTRTNPRADDRSARLAPARRHVHGRSRRRSRPPTATSTEPRGRSPSRSPRRRHRRPTPSPTAPDAHPRQRPRRRAPQPTASPSASPTPHRRRPPSPDPGAPTSGTGDVHPADRRGPGHRRGRRPGSCSAAARARTADRVTSRLRRRRRGRWRVGAAGRARRGRPRSRRTRSTRPTRAGCRSRSTSPGPRRRSPCRSSSCSSATSAPSGPTRAPPATCRRRRSASACGSSASSAGRGSSPRASPAARAAAEVATLFLWVYGWVGVAIVVGAHRAGLALARPVLDAPRPRRVGRPPARARGRGTSPTTRRALGRWPAVVGFAVVVWLELVARGRHPTSCSSSLVGYTALTLAMMAQFGRDTWRSHAEVFTVWFRLLGRLAPYALVDEDGPRPASAVRERPARARLDAGRRRHRRARRRLDPVRRPVADADLVRPVRGHRAAAADASCCSASSGIVVGGRAGRHPDRRRRRDRRPACCRSPSAT